MSISKGESFRRLGLQQFQCLLSCESVAFFGAAKLGGPELYGWKQLMAADRAIHEKISVFLARHSS